MCGIISFRGFSNSYDAADIVLQGLKRLEYRGYDSWGIAVGGEKDFHMVKKVGPVGDVNRSELTVPGQNQIAIGHSRWATNGGVTEYNAHPHLSNSKRIALAHNGIVENAATLKSNLLSKGYTFQSETDSEVIANLLQEQLQKHQLNEAVRQAFLQLKGRNAIVVLDRQTKTIIGARFGSPLIIGIDEDAYFLASDVPAFLSHTRNVNYLDDFQMVVIDDQLKYFDINDGEPIQRRTLKIDWDADQAQKGDFEHFMIKEIMEQKDTIRRAIGQDMRDLQEAAEMIKKARGTFLSGCGTAGKVCHIGEYFFNHIAKRHTNFVIASEFNNYTPFLTDQSLMVVVSQSGETADVLEAMEQAKEKRVKILSLVNVRGSSIMRASDKSLLIKAGPEQAVASTKATTAQLSLLALLAYAANEHLNQGRIRLVELAGQVNEMLNPRYEEFIRTVAEQLQHKKDMYIIGRGVNYPLALECAIKLQEVSYIHGEGFAGGELKHGPLALIEKETPVVALVANDQNQSAILSNAMEVKSRGGMIIGISPQHHEVFDHWIRVPDVGILSPIVNIIPIQILAYQLGVLRGNNPDKPRNLAKSVTVK